MVSIYRNILLYIVGLDGGHRRLLSMRYWMGLVILVCIRMVGFNGVLAKILIVIVIKTKEIIRCP
jgi:hypothetical protein